MRSRTRLLTPVLAALAVGAAMLLPGAAWAGGRHCRGHHAHYGGYYGGGRCYHRSYGDYAYYRPGCRRGGYYETVYYRPRYHRTYYYEDVYDGPRCYRPRYETAYYAPAYYRPHYASYYGGRHCRRRSHVAVSVALGGLFVHYRN